FRSPTGDRQWDGQTHSVTLITGDRVMVTSLANGKHRVTYAPGAGREHVGFLKRVGKDRIDIIPSDALRPLSAGRLDPRLFEVLGLIRQGYDDRSGADIPLIAQGNTRAAVSGATTVRALPSINAVAIRESKRSAATFWASASGYTKIWLDGRSKPADDESNIQIGVPQAWQAGFTGRGVTVAVLDTGYDASHPDLSQVAEAKDFTGSAAGPKDEHGHGTHVSSIIAGSGSGSAGKYKGVAPDAKLLAGRVCGLQWCEDSAVIAGMEWAVDRQAKVVNLSLGSDYPTDGTDPLALAVNTLTRSGTLFVAAVGNHGYSSWVSSPAAADAALAVGSVNRSDEHSWFSNRGPRIGDFAVKPEILAPGEGIVAARAAGTSMGEPVDALYTRASGTSMATPHVAGAAAILAQQHPDWTPAQLKDALMSNAKPLQLWLFSQGAGRADIGRAVTQHLYAQPAASSLGYLSWPYQPTPVTRKVAYRNDGEAAVTLTPELTVTDPRNEGPGPDGSITLDKQQVTVPAHGSAELGVTLHPSALIGAGAGTYSVRIDAKAATARVQTVFSFTTEAESYDVTVNLIDRQGAPATDELPQHVDFNELDSELPSPPRAEVRNGTATVRLAKGPYAVVGDIFTAKGTPDPNTAQITVATAPKVVVDRPGIVLTFDARKGKRASVKVDAPNAIAHFTAVELQFVTHAPWGDSPFMVGFGVPPANELYAVPVQSDPAEFAFGLNTITISPPGAALAYTYYLAFPSAGRIPDDLAFRARNSELGTVYNRYRSQGVDALGARAVLAYYLPGQTAAAGLFIDIPLPGRRVEYFSAGPMWMGILEQRPLDQPQITRPEGAVVTGEERFSKGENRYQEWNNAVLGPDLSTHNWGTGIARYGDSLQAIVPLFAPSEAGHHGMTFFDLSYATGSTTLSKDGAVVGRYPLPGLGFFNLSPDPASYTLAVQARRNVRWSSLAPSVDTEWTFTTSGSQSGQYLPLPTVKISGNLDDRNRAPASTGFPLQLKVGLQANSTDRK
ncbi:MAG TPA: serine protease, partial [Micromonosporaceae bacterium]|nr:serine protease [Micromonosporaceae bacterium]